MRMPLVWIAGAITLLLAIVIAFEAVAGDAWSSFFAGREPLTWDGFVALARYEHDHNNPRWGQLVLAITYHHRAIAVVITPLAITATVLVAMTLVRGRRPRVRDRRDAWFFVCLFATFAITTPDVGLVWFYRPSCANYVYPLLIQLAWLVPYRSLIERPSQRPVLTALVIVPLGVLAGAGNEHVGPALAVAALACMVIAARRDRRVPPWSILGVIALVAGTVFLLAAPAQAVRYDALARQHSWVSPLVERGIVGALAVLGRQLAWASVVTLVLVFAARAVGWPRIAARTSRFAFGALGIATIMVATALLSPKLPTRLLAAPAAMITIAMGFVITDLSRYVRSAKIVRTSCAVISAAVLAYALVVHVVTGIEWRERLALLESAPRGTALDVPRYTFQRPWFVSFGDDFRSDRLRERLARRLGLAAIRRR
jgi:hypothetical protein